MGAVVLFLAAFLASAVEGVEALTIVLAVGVTRGWRSTMLGVASATGALVLVVAALGPALTQVPIDGLRLVVGGLLLVFGLQWLRKAILRAAGVKAVHDEDAIYREEVEQARAVTAAAGTDWYAFTVAFKGVFLEGLEVVFVVLTFGTSQHHVLLAAAGAGAAVVVVLAAGLAVHRPLSRVPENSMKFCVGVMLTTFGVFWGAEGAGVRWPHGDAFIPGILVFVLALALGLVGAARQVAGRPAASVPA